MAFAVIGASCDWREPSVVPFYLGMAKSEEEALAMIERDKADNKAGAIDCMDGEPVRFEEDETTLRIYDGGTDDFMAWIEYAIQPI